MNRGGAVSYIAKYISKNIDGYALDGEIDNDTGKPLSDTAAAVTAWAATWRIPQFQFYNLPSKGLTASAASCAVFLSQSRSVMWRKRSGLLPIKAF